MARRCTVAGKYLRRGARIGDEKLLIKGVTYGTFRTAEGNDGFPARDVVERDLAAMAANGINTLRTYTTPPIWLLDMALEHDLHVIAGLAWEGHVAFLDAGLERDIVERTRADVRRCAGHPALLAFAIGNEIPSSIVRWQGARRVERFLERLARVVKDEDPEGLVTYVNYPTTEYLDLPFLDFVSFNVFLEDQEPFSAYIARLQNLAGGRPLVLTEIGLDSARHGEERQAELLSEQIGAAFKDGCAGTFVFAWTDEWHRGGHDVAEWDFGLVDRARKPKPALAAVRDAYANAPFPNHRSWPLVSVVVCSYNGAATIRECLDGTERLDYPNYEVIVVDDGSTDDTRAIAEERGHTVLASHQRGLSAARNVGLAAAKGEYVVYTDDDAVPDRHWLKHVVRAFESGDYVAMGGPNIPPPGGSLTADCVAASPGGPNHVLLSDVEAEHIPGCNSAFRRDALLEIGGFDEQFRIAGDDVDVCWRLQERGWHIGFAPGAVVLHRRRGSIRSYLRQQFEYGKAEAMLERKWPDRYNRSGHLSWTGHVYAPQRALSRRWRIYYGRWGTEAFQPAEVRGPGPLASIPLMPEWYLVIFGLALLAAIGLDWSPLLLAGPLAAAAGVALGLHAFVNARRGVADMPIASSSRTRRLALVFVLHMLQPLVRLSGRIRNGLSPWRRSRGPRPVLAPWRRGKVWSEVWQSPEQWVSLLERRLLFFGSSVFPGGAWDSWDLEVRGGLFGGVRLQLGVEEHGEGRQLVHWRYRARPLGWAVVASLLLLVLAAIAILDGNPVASALLAGVGAALGSVVLVHTAGAAGAAVAAASGLDAEERVVLKPAERDTEGVAVTNGLPPLEVADASKFQSALDDVRPRDRAARQV